MKGIDREKLRSGSRFVSRTKNKTGVVAWQNMFQASSIVSR